MKLLFVTHYAGMYGANKSMLALQKHLIKEGFAIHVLIPREGPLVSFLEDTGISYTILPYYWWVRETKGLFQWALNWRKQFINYRRAKRYANILQNEHFDAVFTNSITINMGALLARIWQIPHYWHLRETMESYHFRYSIGKKLSKRFLKNAATRYIAISDYVLNSYKNILPADKIVRIYNGVSLSEEYKKDYFNSNVVNFCIVGVICEQKGQLQAVMALHQAIKQKEENLRLHLVGTSKEHYMQKINDYIEDNKLSNYIKIWGHKSNIHEILRQMDVGVVCARDEAFGRITIEFMLHSMPILASDSGANSELIKENIGHIYPHNNTEALSKLMIDYSNCRKLIINKGSMAQQYAKEQFSSEKNASLIFQLIQKTII